MSNPSVPLRFGILGAADIAPKALISPAKKIVSAEVVRLAARDRARAQAYAAEHGIPHVSDDYASLIAADDIDVVYNPLPMSLHAEWTIAALRAGKDVLCEKPFASNADEAAEMVRVAAEEGRVLGEAFHYRYHPIIRRVLDEVASGRIGTVTRVEGYFAVSIAKPNLRWEYEQSGGSTMDLGCYPIHWVRDVVGEEPTVLSASAEVGAPDIDGSLTAELAFPSGATGLIHSSMTTERPDIRLEVMGTNGHITVVNPLAPQDGNDLTITTGSGADAVSTSGAVEAGNTYEHMVRAFIDHVRHGSPFPTQGQDSIANMAVIDAAYRAADLPVHGTR